MKKVMENEEHKIDEHLVTKQTFEVAVGAVALCTKMEREKSHDAQRMCQDT